MRIELLQGVVIAGKGAQRKGAVVEAPDRQAKELIRVGKAVAVAEKAKTVGEKSTDKK